jgi:hypothetical protein
MTPTQLERAARHYCALSNINPDEQLKLQKPIPGAHGPIDSVPRWKVISNALADQKRVNDALEAGLAGE